VRALLSPRMVLDPITAPDSTTNDDGPPKPQSLTERGRRHAVYLNIDSPLLGPESSAPSAVSSLATSQAHLHRSGAGKDVRHTVDLTDLIESGPLMPFMLDLGRVVPPGDTPTASHRKARFVLDVPRRQQDPTQPLVGTLERDTVGPAFWPSPPPPNAGPPALASPAARHRRAAAPHVNHEAQAEILQAMVDEPLKSHRPERFGKSRYFHDSQLKKRYTSRLGVSPRTTSTVSRSSLGQQLEQRYAHRT